MQQLFNDSMGKMVLELYWDHAPKTCRNFAELAQRGYYNNSILHRIIPDFMVQASFHFSFAMPNILSLLFLLLNFRAAIQQEQVSR